MYVQIVVIRDASEMADLEPFGIYRAIAFHGSGQPVNCCPTNPWLGPTPSNANRARCVCPAAPSSHEPTDRTLPRSARHWNVTDASARAQTREEGAAGGQSPPASFSTTPLSFSKTLLCTRSDPGGHGLRREQGASAETHRRSDLVGLDFVVGHYY